MKPALTLICAFLLSSAVYAQAPSSNLPQRNPIVPPGPVPISEEPHHRLVLQNDFIRVYNVMVPPLDATLLHQHDHPYLYVTLGPADIINAIVGKPELHQILQDGETHYSPGSFAHIARTDSGTLSQHHHRTHSPAGHRQESLQASAARTAGRVPAAAGTRQ